MLNAGLSKVFCVNIMHVFGFRLCLLFILWLFPLPPSLGRRLPSRTAALQSAAGEGLGRFWEGKYLSFLRLQQGEREVGQPTALVVGCRGGRPARVI